MLKQLPLSKVINNFVAFQLGWLLSAYWHDGRSLLVNLALLFWLYHVEPWSKLRIKFTLMAALLGIFLDSLLVLVGILQFGEQLILPLWFASLWLLFATTLSVSLSWLMQKPLLSVVFGALFGPMAYWAGSQFNALAVTSSLYYPVIAFVWGILMLIFGFLYRRRPVNSLVLGSLD